jgi:V8-like Glu-specific endopeptidase
VLGGDNIASLNREGKVWSLADIVKKELTENPKEYDVIHFVGYTMFPPRAIKKGAPAKPKKSDANTNQGYLIFSGYPAPRAVPIANVAKWIKATTVELVYLSCCRSSSGRAAAEFARNDVRMTIGFNWDLDDERTGRFTRIFYDELVQGGLKVCSAIRAAREKVKESENQHPIWASSVLFAQPLKWPDVEGVLRPPNRKRVQSPPAKPPSRKQTRNEERPMARELSFKDKAALTKFLAKRANLSGLNSDAYFKYLVTRSDFEENLKLGGSGGYNGIVTVDAQRIVDWAVGVGTNPKDQNQALGTILLPVLGDDIGLEDCTFVAGLIVAYGLAQSDSDIVDLRSRYQIPEQPVSGVSVDIGPRVEWAKDTLELQSWFAPDPGWLDVGTITTAAKRARSVCRVEVGKTGAMGTGILIGRDLVLTNYHVLAGGLNEDPKILEQMAPGTTLRFGAFASEVTSANGQEVGLAGAAPVVAFSKDNDFVLLRAASSISQAINIAPFALLGSMPKRKEALNVLQHPQGGPMKLALSASGVTWVDPDSVKVQYTTKVAKGSSGSPCFDARWNLIALHHAGSRSLGEGILMAPIFDQIRDHLN